MPIDNLRNELVSAYYDNSVLLDTAMAIDNFLENTAMIYPYKNWFDGEIVAGPTVKRYWVSLILKYDHNKMPDPEGGMVLVRLGCKVFYKKFKQKVEVDVKSKDDLDKRDRPKTTIEPCWLVKIVIPKKFLENEKLQDLEILDKDVEVDEIEDAMNSGMADTSVQAQTPEDRAGGETPIAGQVTGSPTGGVNAEGKPVNG